MTAFLSSAPPQFERMSPHLLDLEVDTLPSPIERPFVAKMDGLGRRNAALRTVPDVDWARFSSRLNSAVLRPGQTLYAPGQDIERVYFPNSGLISLLAETEAESVEVAVVGNEGVVGALAALNGEPSNMRALVQAPGTALWFSASDLREEYARGGAFGRWVLRYFGYLLAHSSQCALCNRLHTVEERLARWLLQCSDRLDSQELSITHEFISQMLGTRRSGVTVGLGVLSKAGLLDLSRGHIVIADPHGLEQTACRCYTALRPSYDGLWQESA